jgi:hypothetical protein
MKKTLIAMSLVFTAALANANMVMIGESATGGLRLMVDAQSLVKNVGNDGVPRYAAAFQYVENGVFEPMIVYATAAASCRQKQGKLSLFEDAAGGGVVNTANYFWVEGGSKMYDFAGIALCALANIDAKKPKKINKEKL